MTKQYGLSYMGSKSKIAKDILKILPSSDNFYDLFAGGCAITHAVLLSRRWKNIIANDINKVPMLFKDAILGKYKNENKWISSKEFKERKKENWIPRENELETYPLYIRFVWSFGNNGDAYIFGEDIEEIKHEAHEFLMNNGYDGTSRKRVELIKKFNLKEKLNGGRAELQQLERLEIYNKDYREVEIKQNSIVYCDIPYGQKENTHEEIKKDYSVEFNTKEFYEWAKSRDFPVYFSSSFCNDKDFTLVLEIKKQCLMNNKGSNKEIIERLYWNNIKIKEDYKQPISKFMIQKTLW